MTTTINAVASTGLVQTSDGSGIVKLQSNGTTTNALAWVNFNGTTSPGTIRSQYNVSSVTKNGTGDYTVNFTNALADANYSVGYSWGSNSLAASSLDPTTARTSSAYRMKVINGAYANVDDAYVNVIVFGN